MHTCFSFLGITHLGEVKWCSEVLLKNADTEIASLIKVAKLRFFILINYNRSLLSSESDCECMSSNSTKYMHVAVKIPVQVLGTATWHEFNIYWIHYCNNRIRWNVTF